jgi:hypothetical protein
VATHAVTQSAAATACGNWLGAFFNIKTIPSRMVLFAQRIRFWKSGRFFGFWVINQQFTGENR